MSSTHTRRPFGRVSPRRRLFALAVGAVSAAVGLGAPPAGAADPIPETNGRGMDLHLYKPAMDSKGWFAVNGADLVGHLDFSVGLNLDYGFGTLAGNTANASAPYLREHGFQGVVQADLGLANWLVLGLAAPIVLANGQPTFELGPTGATYDVPAYQVEALANVTLNAKLRLLRPQGGVGLALVTRLGPEVGGSRAFGAEPEFYVWPELVFEARAGQDGFFRFGLNGGFRAHTGANPTFGLRADGSTQLAQGVLQYGQLATAGVAMSLRPVRQLELAAETYATYLVDGASDDRQRISAEALGGLKLYVEGRSHLSLAGGGGYVPGFQAATARGVVSFVFEPPLGDRDGDGILDVDDDCPRDAEDKDGFEDTLADSPKGFYGCPDPDNDQDGIPDVRDRCKNLAEDKDGDEDTDGCPETRDLDTDGDGLRDSRDRCVNEPEDIDEFEDDDGCPDLDDDKDGIPDTKDGESRRCKDTPEDMDGFEDDDGCPDPDNDKDGIPDAVDGPDGSCKNDPETVNGVDDDDGCPDKGKIVLSQNEVVVLEKIQFKTGSAQILPASDAVLDAMATVLRGHPELELVEVQGHADVRAPDAFNLKLTQDRVKAVVAALVARGTEPARLRGVGYGEYCPLDPGKAESAHEKNRRVELKVVRTSAGPTGVALGCELSRKKGVVSTSP